MAKAPAPPPAPSSQADDIDRQLVQAALRKRQLGQTPTAREHAALRKFESARDEDSRWQHYRTIPQKHWRTMSGRQAKIINEQATTYGIPFDGAEIDLPKVVKALHDFLAQHHRKFKRLDDEDSLLAGGDSPALERYREEKAKLARLDRLEREEELIPRDKIHAGMIQIANILRGMGDTLQKKYGPDALAIVEQYLTNADAAIAELFGD